jgi:hypothetical protein
MGILIDLAMPKLNWANEAAAVKQNLNVLFGMGAATLVAAIAVMFDMRILDGIGGAPAALASIALVLILAAAPYALVLTFGVRRFGSLES